MRLRQLVADAVIDAVRCTEADAKINTGPIDIGAVLLDLLIEHGRVTTQVTAKQIGFGDAKPYIGPAAGCANRRLKPASRAQKIAFIDAKVKARLVQ